MRRKRLKGRRKKIDKSVLAIPIPKRINDEEFRRWIAELDCIVTGLSVDIQCSHIRHETGTGTAQKPSDPGNCVPLHFLEHHKSHQMGELRYWAQFGGIAGVKSLSLQLSTIYVTTKCRAEVRRATLEWRKTW